MSQLRYKIGYVDLRRSIEEIFSNIRARTEIRKSEKNNIKIEVYFDNKPSHILKSCTSILEKLLSNELVPFSPIFSSILSDKNNILLVATKDEAVISFVVLSPKTKNVFFENYKTAYLELSATDDNYKNLCPNYLLLWRSILLLKERNYDYFNLGLLEYEKSKDADIDKVAFFKRKWSIIERVESERVGLARFLFIRYFKKYHFVKKLVYAFRTKISNG